MAGPCEYNGAFYYKNRGKIEKFEETVVYHLSCVKCVRKEILVAGYTTITGARVYVTKIG